MLSRRGALYVGAAALSYVLIAVHLHLSVLHPDLSKPLVDIAGGDEVFFHAIFFKGVLENGWQLSNPAIGAPGSGALFGFPVGDLTLVGLVALLRPFHPDHLAVCNAMALASYPLTTVFAVHALRRLGVRILAVPAALLFTFVHYHQARAFGGHIPLGLGVFVIPLAVAVACDLCEPSFGEVWSAGFVLRMLLVTELIAATGTIYYGLFSAYLIVVAAAVRVARERSWRGLRVPAAFLFAAIGWLAAMQLPAALAAIHRGYAPGVDRSPGEAEVFGLKLVELVFPSNGHRLPFLDAAASRYRRLAPLVNENQLAYVGAFAVAGLTLMAVDSIRRRGMSAGSPSLSLSTRRASTLRLFVLALFALGTVGGLGAAVAFVGVPQIRSYNRVSIFIAFCALTYLALALETHVARLGGTARIAMWGVCGVLTGLGLLEETLPWHADRARAVAVYGEMGTFVERVEARVPPGTRIFELPFMMFPDGPPAVDLPDYALLVPYLHSHQLIWSYGAMPGTPEASWNRETAELPAAEMIDRLVAADFGGVWVGTKGFADGGAAIEAQLTAQLGEPLRDATGQDLFYSLAEVTARRKLAWGGEGFARRRAAALPVRLDVRAGFYRNDGTSRDWCGPRCTLGLSNLLSTPETVAVDLELTRPGDGATVTVQTPEGDEKVQLVADAPTRVHRVVTVPPGGTFWTLSASGKAAPIPPPEPRAIWFGVTNVKVEPVTP